MDDTIIPPPVFHILRKEQCRSLPLDKLRMRLESLEKAESHEIEEIRKRYTQEIAEIQRQVQGLYLW
ncbi:hypothetical protein HDU97_009468 [Phlyctochytrium planicorne]|nr:hypothetical protein HDU97_009468 [Phlyctochytrium planicorne]